MLYNIFLKYFWIFFFGMLVFLHSLASYKSLSFQLPIHLVVGGDWVKFYFLRVTWIHLIIENIPVLQTIYNIIQKTQIWQRRNFLEDFVKELLFSGLHNPARARIEAKRFSEWSQNEMVAKPETNFCWAHYLASWVYGVVSKIMRFNTAGLFLVGLCEDACPHR